MFARISKLLPFLLVAILLAGCSGVWMNAEYSKLLDKTAALSAETAERAEAGKLSEAEMKESLAKQAETWLTFKKAKDGEK